MDAKTESPQAKSLRVLIVEDEARDADLVQRELRREGMKFEARRVETQEDFLRELGEFRPHIVLSDYNMPSFDGITALRLTREHAPDTPFIIVTGSMSEETAVECIKAGADDYVLKDRRSRLPSAVKAALHKTSLERERREAQEAMRLSAREWRTTFDAMADLVCVLGPDRTVLRCNRAFREFVGRDWEDILGQPCFKMLHPDRPGASACPFPAMQEKQETSGTDIQMKGRWFHVNVDPLLAEDGSLLGGILVLTDITERRAAERATLESGQRYRTLFRAGTDAIFVYLIGPDGSPQLFIEVNEVACQMYGYSREELLGMTAGDLVAPESRQHMPAVMAQLAAEGRARFEWEDRAKDGRQIPVEVSLTAFEMNGRPTGMAVVRDITERKASEAKLRESEERYRSLYVDSRDAIMMVSQAGRFLAANPATIELFACQDEQHFTTQTPASLSPEYQPDGLRSADKAPEMIRLAFQKGSHFFEWMHRRANGTDFPATVLLSRLEGSGTQILQATVRDITELKETQAALGEQLRFVQSLLDTLPTPVFHKDLAGRYTLCNRAFAEMHRRPASEIVGRTMFDLLPQDAAEEQDRIDHNLLEHPRPHRFETATVGVPEFATRQIVIHKAVIRDLEDRPSGIIGVMVDITELKSAQTALQESREKYRSMVDNIGIGVTLISPDLRVLELNAQMRTWNPGVHPGGPMPCYAVFNNPPREGPCSYCPTVKTLADGQVHEAVTDTPAGDKVRNYRVVASPVFDASGKVTGAIEMVEDITDRLLLEAQFRQAQKMEAVGQLAGGVAHDFNNILTGIMGYTRLQLDDAAQGTELFVDLTEILGLSQRAANLTRQLLAFSRRQTLIPQVLDLNHVVADMAKMLGRLIGEDIDLRFVPAAELDRIKADPGQVEQVLMNLAVNARDAMPKGGQLTIETANVTLDEHYVATHADTQRGAHVVLAVTDTGCGMSKEMLQRIFEPFFTTKEVGKGTGLGLATTFGIVKQHNGSIQVYSEVGRGTTFRVYFPVTTETADGALRQATAKASGGNETILVVEDEEAVRDIAQRILTQHGYRVLTATDGDEAEALFEKHRDGIALVLTDVIMPGTSGRVLSERLRLLNPSLRVMFMSGYSDNAVFRHGVLGEEMAFIGKPFTQEDLLLAVRKVLDTP